MTPRPLDLAGACRLVAFAGRVATVDSPDPHPAGARVELRRGALPPGVAVAGKVVDVVRGPAGFRLRVRLFALPRAAREALEAALGGG
jgi:hypothetical protein